jgi:hypothetical protein
MPWRGTDPMEERMAFISDWQRQVRCDPQRISMAELCRNYGVSRRSGYATVLFHDATRRHRHAGARRS